MKNILITLLTVCTFQEWQISSYLEQLLACSSRFSLLVSLIQRLGSALKWLASYATAVAASSLQGHQNAG